jgi:signal peptidase I
MSASLVGAALFIMYAALAHYWRYHLPGGRILSNLPLSVASRCRDADDLRRFASAQALLAALSGRATRRRWARALSPDAQAELASRLSNVRAAIDRHSDPSLQNEVAGLRALTAPLLRMRQFRETVGSVVAIVLVITLALGLRAFAFETFAVASASMLPTLEPGDVILGRRLGDHALSGRNWAPRRGDVVVFSTKAIDAAWPEGTPDHLVKRVIGLPGDRIEVRLDSAIINGWTVPSCDVGTYTYVVPGGDGTFIRGRMKVEFLEGRSYLSLRPPSAVPFEEYVVQPGEFFVLGDNRHNSYDSRAWHGGVPLATIEAQVQRFLRGTHRDGSADFTRLMRSIDASGVHMEGLDQGALREQLARCLRERPKDVPPGPASPPDGKRAPALAPLGPY